MKIVDRYFIKQFVQTTVFALATFTIIFIVVDLMENLDDFIDQAVPNNLIFEYYIYFAPEIIRLMTPVGVFLACLFTVGKMANQNELTAVKSSGVSLYRIMLPFIVTAFFISAFSIYFGGYVVPLANKGKVSIERNYMRKGIESQGSNIFFQDTDTRIVSISYFDLKGLQATNVSIQEFSKKNPTSMVQRIDAVRMRFDTLKNVWTLFDGTQREFQNLHEQMNVFDTLTYTQLNFKPHDISIKQQKPEEMNLSELKNFFEYQSRTGNDPTRTLIEYHSRVSFSMASVIVIFLGLPLASVKRRGGLAMQFGISLGFTFLYLGFMKISEAFGKNGVLDPLITAWFANTIFLIAGIINMIKVQK